MGAAIEAVSSAARVAVGQCARDLLAQSRQRVPYDQGDLSRSGRADVSDEGGAVVGTVSYDTPYAVRQHEDTTLRHQDGRTADYLGGPARERAQAYQQWIAQAISRNLR